MLENTEKNENEAGVGPFLKKDNENVIKAPVFGIDQTWILILHSLNSLSNSFSLTISVTRFGNFLHFGQQFKAGVNNYFTQIAHISRNFCKGVKIINYSTEIIFGQLL